MKKKTLHKIGICLVAFFLTTKAQSQSNYKYKAPLESVVATKFYKILLPPQVVAKCKDGLEDIRVFDEDGKQVPYILQEDLPAFKTENFTEFPVIKFTREKDKQTHIILKNTSGHAIDNLLLFIKNMVASRAFSITGSDDSIHWFIIKENIYLENTFSNDRDNTINALSFPKSNYTYFQIIILGENVIPFNIIKAGIYKEDILYGKYTELPGSVVIQKDSLDKKSYAQLRFNDFYRINKLHIHVQGPKYFKRSFSIRQINTSNNNFVKDGYLVSDSANSFIINSKTNQLQLVINNEDNAPLTIKAADAYQLNISVLTYLQANKEYYLYFGDSTAQSPKYDLGFFKDSVEKNPVELSVKTIETNNALHEKNKTPGSGIGKRTLWIIITGILLILSFFTFKMMREVDKKKGKEQ
ncbi:MAG: hypothetical protein ABI472_19210 [Ginsengibacter sp.]